MLTLGEAAVFCAGALVLLLPPQLKPVESSITNDRQRSLDDNMIDFMSLTISMFDDITGTSLS